MREDTLSGATARAQAWLSENGKGRRATINDVAALSGVSKKTVSWIINKSPKVKPATRDLVDAVIAAIDYRPDPQARGLAFRKSFLIGMVYDNPNPQYIVNMQQGILSGLKGTGYELVVHPCERGNPNNSKDVQAFAERLNLAGAILTPSISEDDALAKALRENGCKYVRIASVALDDPEKMIVTNDRLGGSLAAQHLTGLGHTQIAFLSGLPSFRSSTERRRGFEDGLAQAGLSLTPDKIYIGDYTYASGIKCGEAMLTLRNPPTAIFAANDEMAAGILHTLLRKGHDVPCFMSIAGFDDFQIARTSFPQLTTVHTPIRDIGKRAAMRALELRSSEVEAMQPVETQPSLVVRASTGPPRA